MILNVYNKLKEDSSFCKLVGKDYMILEYKCPVDADKLQVLLESNVITYVISGKKDWIAGDKTYHVKEGDAVFMRKGVYTIRQFLDVDHCVLVFFIHDDFIRTFIRDNNVQSESPLPETIDDKIFPLQVDDSMQSLFHSIFAYLKMAPDVPRNLVEIKFKELLFNIVLNPAHKKLTQYFGALNQAGPTKLDDVMLKNFQFDLPMEEFAQLCGRSLSTFKREFKNVYRQTPGKWLTERRLEHASALLISSHLNVNEIGYESGFRNPSHFNKTFKEKYHLTPKQFRSIHWHNGLLKGATIKNRAIPVTTTRSTIFR